jgi:transposase
MCIGSTQQLKMTAGMDLGDNFSHLCLIDTQCGELIEESRLRTTPEAMRRRFDSERPPRVAIEVGTHSPWVSRLLTECGHEVLIANPRKTRLIYGQRRKTDKLDALRSWPASLGPIPRRVAYFRLRLG